MLRLATTTKTMSPTAASGPDTPAWARLLPAANDSARFFGLTPLSSNASPVAFGGDSESIDAIHFGGAFSVSSLWVRQLRTASTTSSTPSTSLIQ